MNVQQVWLAQSSQAPRISLEYIRHRTDTLERRSRKDAVLGYVICVSACAFWGWVAWTHFSAQPLMLAAIAWYGLFALYTMYRLNRHAALQVSLADAGVLDTLRFHRKQLEQQRDFRRGTWRWQFSAVLPGLVLQLAASIAYSSPTKSIVFLIVVTTLGFALAVVVGKYQARRAQREIDALDSLAGGS
jgi:hypothetical protein